MLYRFAYTAIPAALLTLSAAAQTAPARYVPSPAFDAASIDRKADPCADFYKFACGNFAANHPIPADQPSTDQFYVLYNVNTQALNGILVKLAADTSANRSANEQKIGDDYAACMDTDAIETEGLSPSSPSSPRSTTSARPACPALAGKLQRIGVDVFFGYGEMQDFKDATKQIAVIDQGGLGLPETRLLPPHRRKGQEPSATSTSPTSPRCSPSPANPPSRPSKDAAASSPSKPRSPRPRRTSPSRRDPENDLPPHAHRRLREDHARASTSTPSSTPSTPPTSPSSTTPTRAYFPAHASQPSCRPTSPPCAPTCATSCSPP